MCIRDRIICATFEQSLSNADFQYKEHIRNHIYNLLTKALGKKILEKIQTLDEDQPKQNLTYWKKLCILGLPPVSLVNNNHPKTIEQIARKIFMCFHAIKDSHEPVSIVVLTTLGISSLIRKKLFPNFLQTLSLIHI